MAACRGGGGSAPGAGSGGDGDKSGGSGNNGGKGDQPGNGVGGGHGDKSTGSGGDGDLADGDTGSMFGTDISEDDVTYVAERGPGPGNSDCYDSKYPPSCPGSLGYQIAALADAKNDPAIQALLRQEAWNSKLKFIRPGCSSSHGAILDILKEWAADSARQLETAYQKQRIVLKEGIRMSMLDSQGYADGIQKVTGWKNYAVGTSIILGKVAVAGVGLKGAGTWTRGVRRVWAKGGSGWSKAYNVAVFGGRVESRRLSQAGFEELVAVRKISAEGVKVKVEVAEQASNLIEDGFSPGQTLLTVGTFVPVAGAAVAAAQATLEFEHQVEEAIQELSESMEQANEQAEHYLELLKSAAELKAEGMKEIAKAVADKMKEVDAKLAACNKQADFGG